MAKIKNAKDEFIGHVNGLPGQAPLEVLCADIQIGNGYGGKSKNIKLTTGYTKDEYDKFLKKLDVEYDSGFGGQNLFGIIWYKDGTWSTRGEYDGSEWYEHHKCPEIPKDLKRIDKEREEKLNTIL